MKKILVIIFVILFIAFGFALRKQQINDQKLELKNAIKEYKNASTKTEEVKTKLTNQEKLNNNEKTKLNDLEEKHKVLVNQFNEYKLKYPQDTTKEIKKMETENKEYAKKISDLENNISQLNEKVAKQEVVKQKEVVSSSSSNRTSSNKESDKTNSHKENNSSSSNNTNSSSNVSNQAESNYENTQSESSETVYANGGHSRSNKYHSSPTAHNMEGAIAMSKSEAISKGYVACKKCY